MKVLFFQLRLEKLTKSSPVLDQERAVGFIYGGISYKRLIPCWYVAPEIIVRIAIAIVAFHHFTGHPYRLTTKKPCHY